MCQSCYFKPSLQTDDTDLFSEICQQISEVHEVSQYPVLSHTTDKDFLMCTQYLLTFCSPPENRCRVNESYVEAPYFRFQVTPCSFYLFMFLVDES